MNDQKQATKDCPASNEQVSHPSTMNSTVDLMELAVESKRIESTNDRLTTNLSDSRTHADATTARARNVKGIDAVGYPMPYSVLLPRTAEREREREREREERMWTYSIDLSLLPLDVEFLSSEPRIHSRWLSTRSTHIFHVVSNFQNAWRERTRFRRRNDLSLSLLLNCSICRKTAVVGRSDRNWPKERSFYKHYTIRILFRHGHGS